MAILSTMSVCSWLMSTIFVSLCFDGFQLLESSRNVDGDGKKRMDEISLGGGWGLPDRVAIVGRIFRYQLPTHDASCGNLTNYQVTVAGEENGKLPSWLTFNQTEASIEGVPMPDVNGQMHSIHVKAICIGSTDKSAIPIKEYFTIKVSDKQDSLELHNDAIFEFKSLKQNLTEDVMLVKCRNEGSVVTATVTIDADERLMTAIERVTLLRRFSAHLGLPETVVRLAPLQDRRVFDDTALVAGPGDTRHPTAAGLVVQWDVGCGNVFAGHMTALELLEVTSQNGTMRKVIAHGVTGWRITSERLNQRRLKRRVYPADPTATLMPSAVRPAARPVPTSTVSETDVPATRIVVVPEATRTLHPSRSEDYESVINPAAVSIKSPTPTTTYVTITPTRVLSTVSGTVSSPVATSVSMMKNTTSSAPVVEIEPSVVTETTTQLRSTDTLPRWTTPTFVTSKLPGVTKRTPKTQRPSTPRSTNRPPVVSKPLEIIQVFVGSQVSFRIPDDTFSDDGGVENLTLLLLLDNQTVPKTSWVKFNGTSRTIYGLASEEHIGSHHYELAAEDKHKKLVKTPFVIRVAPHPAAHKPSNEFSVTFDLDYEKVKSDTETKLNLIDKIAAAFGDKDASKMTILRISQGSVVITYTNNSLPAEPCPQKEIEALLRILLQPDGQINETFAKAMEPYRVTKADGKFTGSCASLDTSTTSSAIQFHTSQPKITVTMADEVDVKPRLQKSDNLLLYILLPLLIFFLLLLLVIVICVVCYKRQRRRQKEEDKLTGLHKGIPIIFADEMEEKQDTPASTLKSRRPDDDERQSVPPPEYPTSKPGSKSSTLRSDYKSPLISDDEEDDDRAVSPPETLPRRTRTEKESASTTTTPLLHFRD